MQLVSRTVISYFKGEASLFRLCEIEAALSDSLPIGRLTNCFLRQSIRPQCSAFYLYLVVLFFLLDLQQYWLHLPLSTCAEACLEEVWN